MAAEEQDARLLAVGYGDHGAEGIGREIAVEVEGAEVLGSDLVVLHDRGVGRDGVTLARENSGGGVGGCQVLVPVRQALDDPRRLQVHEHGQIVRRVRRLEHAHDAHVERVGTGQSEDGLG